MNRKRVQRLVRQMGLCALYPKPRTSQPAVGHTVYPYLLRGLSIERPNQVWATDICYIPMAHGFMYLVAIMDWYSRRVLAWRVSNTFDSDFCVEALEDALTRYGPPEIFNTDQGAQFTSSRLLKNTRIGLFSWPSCVSRPPRQRCARGHAVPTRGPATPAAGDQGHLASRFRNRTKL